MPTLKEVIVESHDDIEIWSSIIIWESPRKELIIQLEFIDYDNHERDHSIYATIDPDEATTMARSLHIDPDSVPRAIFERFGDTSNTTVPSKVEATFQEILNFILDCGARYRLKYD